MLSPDLYELRFAEYRELFFPLALPPIHDPPLIKTARSKSGRPGKNRATTTSFFHIHTFSYTCTLNWTLKIPTSAVIEPTHTHIHVDYTFFSPVAVSTFAKENAINGPIEKFLHATRSIRTASPKRRMLISVQFDGAKLDNLPIHRTPVATFCIDRHRVFNAAGG